MPRQVLGHASVASSPRDGEAVTVTFTFARHVRHHQLLDPVERQDLVARVLELLQQDHRDRVTVCSSVNASITWLPPTRPIPLSVPARPPNGRCASQ